MKYCPQCNTQYADASRTTCKDDGTPLSTALAPAADPNWTPQVAVDDERVSGRVTPEIHTVTKILTVVAGIVGIIGLWFDWDLVTALASLTLGGIWLSEIRKSRERAALKPFAFIVIGLASLKILWLLWTRFSG